MTQHFHPLRTNRDLALAIAILVLAAASSASGQEASNTSLPPGWVPQTPTGLVAEPPPLLKKLMNASDGVMTYDAEPKDGLYAELGDMITGAGWISAGPGYRFHVLNKRAFVDASAAVSWNIYKVAQTRFEFPHLAHDRLVVGAQAMYQDVVQVDYFGTGPDSLEAGESAYRFNNYDVLGYTTVRPATWFSVNGRVGWLLSPNLSTATGRNVTVPNTIDLFDESTAPGLLTQPTFLHADASIAADWRDHAGHPTRGGLYRATITSYSDRDAGTYTFRRYEVEAAQFVPLFTNKWILALHGWEVFSDASSGRLVPFYLMPSLGGQNTLRGYSDYRFHDSDMQVFNAESRWALFAHIDAAVFVDTGKVAPRAGDLDFKHMRRSYGAGLRLHNATSTLGRLDVGHGAEGWRVIFKISDPFKRGTPAFGRSSVAPFVP
jgi:hypothetical protein